MESFRLLTRLGELLTYPLFTVQDTHITLLTGLALVLLVWGTFTVAGWVERSLLQRFFLRFQLERGLAFTLGRIIQYVIVGIGLIIGLQLIGLDLGAIAVFAGFLSIGIGFGLQNVTSNFISGLIIMFERPIQPGDRVKVGDNIGQVANIRLRSTTIVTNDGIAIIVPNSEFISQQVINWSFGDPKLRLRVPVGFAYGTDPEAAKALLLEAAAAHPHVLTTPAADVWLMAFGDNALQFELLAWIDDAPAEHLIRSGLNYTILKLANERGLEIAFPQRDLHIRSSVPVKLEWPPQGAPAVRPTDSTERGPA